MKYILASASPRRQEILKNCGYDFEVIPADIEEKIEPNTPCEQVPEKLAIQKAEAVFENHKDATIISADTVVVINGKILGKPKNEDDAFCMLKQLSGNTHFVYTGVCIKNSKVTESFCQCTEVTFYPLTDEQIREYIATGEPMDKAGAYGIQCKGALLVESIKGDYFNVVGLPVAQLARKLDFILHN
ncbi:MAG: Maf family protein [Clostridiales bacterium]|nr:Maf family protein [Clostridiales bacterium]